MNIARRVFCLALTGSLMACATAPRAHRGRGWEFLGRRQVDFRVDHDVIEVGRMEGRFNELRFVVHGGAIEMYDVVVVLGDGETVSAVVTGARGDLRVGLPWQAVSPVATKPTARSRK